MSSVALATVCAANLRFTIDESYSLVVNASGSRNAVWYDREFAPTFGMDRRIMRSGWLSSGSRLKVLLNVWQQILALNSKGMFGIGSREWVDLLVLHPMVGCEVNILSWYYRPAGKAARRSVEGFVIIDTTSQEGERRVFKQEHNGIVSPITDHVFPVVGLVFCWFTDI